MKLWKGKKAGRIVAWLLAGAMVLSGTTVTPASAEEPVTVTDGDAMVSGGDLGGASLFDAGVMLAAADDNTHTFDPAYLSADGVTDKDPIAEGTELDADGYFKVE